MPALADVAREKLHTLETAQRKRMLTPLERLQNPYVMRGGKRLISFSCNDYLGLSHHPQVKAAAVQALEHYGTGVGASRLVTGNHPLYAKLESALAKREKTQAALVFGSGYLANLGIISALMGKGDLIVTDKLVHACLIDGALLSGAKLLRFKHNDTADCACILKQHRKEYRHALIVTDAVFSMDGDMAPLATLRECAEAHEAWLMADGAHLLSPLDTPVDIYVGTLSKMLGSYGGYVCAQKPVIDYLMTTARTLMFSTGLPPASLAASLAALEIIKNAPHLLHVPLKKAQLFTEALGLPKAESQIVPVILGSEYNALKAASILEKEGYLAIAIRPPTVPENTSRLRFAFSALHTDEDVLAVARVIKQRILL